MIFEESNWVIVLVERYNYKSKQDEGVKKKIKREKRNKNRRFWWWWERKKKNC